MAAELKRAMAMAASFMVDDTKRTRLLFMSCELFSFAPRGCTFYTAQLPTRSAWIWRTLTTALHDGDMLIPARLKVRGKFASGMAVNFRLADAAVSVPRSES